ncbi:DUF445 domain-containing protein [Chitinophaga qingshengii]|uniref:DUF445 family protein n=1 Tax=Chitinophaga qingshengii TaxID=1569794 RepID=A0ABR7THF9_9BACT|nr:hypothetical protein [Chitinophaga qingshengii]MBC9929941.1 hypothetical protein [Chitinophaga qingshengii]
MIYLLPIITALLGTFIHYLAVQLLFKKILPARQQALAKQLGAFAGQQLSFSTIKSKLTDPEKIKNIIPLVEAHLDTFLREKLPKAMPVLSMFIGDSIVNQIKSHLVAELDTLFPVMISQYLDNVEKDLNIEKIVADKIAGISADELQKISQQFLHKEISQFKLLGAFTGFVSGIAAIVILIFC